MESARDQEPEAPRNTKPLDSGLLVVIVNYRTAKLTIDCLASLEPEVRSLPGVDVQVEVTDNASGDDSVVQLEAAVRDQGWSSWASIRPLDRNGGFSYGNNGAIRPALASAHPPKYIWLLNPDTIVRPGAMATLWKFLETHPEAGIAGCRLVNLAGVAEHSAFRFPSVLGEVEGGLRLGLVSRLLSRWVVSPPPPSEPSPCDWASGASLLVRRAVFESIGLLDEQYFMYFEETDFCLQARRAGWQCWYVPTAEVVHLAGQSSGVSGEVARGKRLPAYWYQARRRFFIKNLGPAQTFIADVMWSLGFLSYRVRHALLRKPDGEPKRRLRDFLYYNFVDRRMSRGQP
jgi:GT2 family glycosyltransferase